MPRIGLVAGYGTLPILFARSAKAKGDTVVVFALKGVTDESIASHADKVHWFEWGQFGKAIMTLIAERVKSIVMLGKIKKEILFKEDERLDEEARKIIGDSADKKDYKLLKGVADVLSKIGVAVMDPSPYLKELIPSKGVITKRRPSKKEELDIEYGLEVARQFSALDIGQTLAVKDKTIIAVEAVEGTDEAIRRAGSLCKNGFTVIKAARPNQDMRFDIPLVGPDTLEVLIAAGGTALALEAEKTFLMDRESVIRRADEKNISISIV